MTAPKRQRLDPAAKAQAALDVAVRKLAALDARIGVAKFTLTALVEQRPVLCREVDYLADHPALNPARGAETGDAFTDADLGVEA